MYTSAWVMIGKNPMKLNNEVPVRTAEPASHILFCSLSKKNSKISKQEVVNGKEGMVTVNGKKILSVNVKIMQARRR